MYNLAVKPSHLGWHFLLWVIKKINDQVTWYRSIQIVASYNYSYKNYTNSYTNVINIIYVIPML